MEKVLRGSGCCCDIRATMSDESSPPERKAPTGTSAIRLRRTELVSNSESSAHKASGLDRAPEVAKE
jgi:hypothetical protein